MDRCGTCAKCIGLELCLLSSVELILWRRSGGDTTKYLNLMGTWMDEFNERGLPL